MGKHCMSCLRVMLIIYNFLFVLIGLGIAGIAIFCFLEPTAQDMAKASGYWEWSKIGLYVLMGVGGLTVIIGTFGCCGAYHESPCLLGTYFTFLFIIFVAEVTVGVLGFFNKKLLLEKTEASMKEGIKAYNDKDADRYMDNVQLWLMCCGANGPQDYKTYGTLIPASCCKKGIDQCAPNGVPIEDAFSGGCAKSYAQYVEKKLPWVLIAVLVIAGIEFLGMIFAMVLCCYVRSIDYHHYTEVDHHTINM